jgi:hypothetical protein
LGKGVVLLGCPLFGTFHPVSCGPVLSGVVADQQKGIDIVQGILPAVLVQDPGFPCQTHGSQAVVLGNHDITGKHPVYQGIVYAVSAFVKNQGFCPVPVKFVGGIAQNQTGECPLFTQPDGNVHHGTAVGINEKFQGDPSFLRRLYHASHCLKRGMEERK